MANCSSSIFSPLLLFEKEQQKQFAIFKEQIILLLFIFPNPAKLLHNNCASHR